MLLGCQKAVKLILQSIRILQFHITVFSKMGYSHMFLLLSLLKMAFPLFQTVLPAFTCSNAFQSACIPVLFTVISEEEEQEQEEERFLSMGSSHYAGFLNIGAAVFSAIPQILEMFPKRRSIL